MPKAITCYNSQLVESSDSKLWSGALHVLVAVLRLEQPQEIMLLEECDVAAAHRRCPANTQRNRKKPFAIATAATRTSNTREPNVRFRS